MGNTETEKSTVFDDVFRTMLERIPRVFIPLINEVFDENCPADAEITQLKNEHITPDGKKITDSHLYVGPSASGRMKRR